MIKRHNTKAVSHTPLRPLPHAALVRVTAGAAPSIDVDTPKLPSMREIVHVQ